MGAPSADMARLAVELGQLASEVRVTSRLICSIHSKGAAVDTGCRVPLEPGQARRVTFRLHADRTAFTGRDPSTGTRVVEPGEIRVGVGGASDQLPLQGSFMLCGPERAVGPGRVLDTPAEVSGLISGAQ